MQFPTIFCTGPTKRQKGRKGATSVFMKFLTIFCTGLTKRQKGRKGATSGQRRRTPSANFAKGQFSSATTGIKQTIDSDILVHIHYTACFIKALPVFPLFPYFLLISFYFFII